MKEPTQYFRSQLFMTGLLRIKSPVKVTSEVYNFSFAGGAILLNIPFQVF